METGNVAQTGKQGGVPARGEPDQTVLSIECGTPYLCLGLRARGQWFSVVHEVGRTHAERLPAALGELYGQAVAQRRADLIVIGTGPGSYTGLRVGASYALGLGRAWSVPVIGVSTLEALTGQHDGEVAVSLDARKEHVYGAVYRAQGGVIAETLQAGAKYPLADFELLAAGLPWQRDVPPDPQTLALNALDHGQSEWVLSYL